MPDIEVRVDRKGSQSLGNSTLGRTRLVDRWQKIPPNDLFSQEHPLTECLDVKWLVSEPKTLGNNELSAKPARTNRVGWAYGTPGNRLKCDRASIETRTHRFCLKDPHQAA